MNGQTNGQTGYSGTQAPIPTHVGNTALDDLLRRTLKVSDPSNPQEIAAALRRLYPDESVAIDREVAGFPFVSQPIAAPTMTVTNPSDNEFGIASNYLDQDLAILTTSPVLRQIQPEMRGIASAVRAAMNEGIGAARLALDPIQRDKAFAARRLLNDYARVARILGALTTEINMQYRRFARSLDQVANLLLVYMGEALAKAGFGAGEFILQVPLSDLQARRSGLIMALRSLLGSVESVYGDEEYGRGRRGYQGLYNAVVTANQIDLKPLLTESGLTTVLNSLVDAAAGGTPDSLRGLGATSSIKVNQLRRLYGMGAQVQTQDPQPPLIAFLVALDLFIAAFNANQAGSRLVTLARPPVLFYGAYAQTWPDAPARRRLVDLTLQRAIFADLLDCITRCSCERVDVGWQIVMDKLLYDLDRAIDLYSLGQDDHGLAEQRASAYGSLMGLLVDNARTSILNIGGAQQILLDATRLNQSGLGGRLAPTLGQIILDLNLPPNIPGIRRIRREELCSQYDSENRMSDLVRTLAPDCISYGSFYDRANINGTVIPFLINRAIGRRGGGVGQYATPDLNIPQPVAMSEEVTAIYTGQQIPGQST